MKELTLNELVLINGGTEGSDAYNAGHEIGEAIGEFVHGVVDFFRGVHSVFDDE